MKRRIPNTIELRYQFINSPDSQERLDDIFDFIFKETVRQMIVEKNKRAEFDNLTEERSTDNNLIQGGQSEGK